jgi:DNA-binding sugar fermentation-stimulating protein
VAKVTTTQLKELNKLQVEAKKRGLISINQSKDLDDMKLNMTLDQYSKAYRRLDEKIVEDKNLERSEKKFDLEMEVRKQLIDEDTKDGNK